MEKENLEEKLNKMKELMDTHNLTLEEKTYIMVMAISEYIKANCEIDVLKLTIYVNKVVEVLEVMQEKISDKETFLIHVTCLKELCEQIETKGLVMKND